jgi:uncharacterized coiled-coil protein SlyX
MRLTRPGWLGINTTAPDMRFHVDEGGILSTGTTGTNPDLGAGTRLMWIPNLAAFRAGRVGVGAGTAAWWDGTNVGVGSAAFGTDNRAAGEDSFAQGQLNNVTGECSMAFGGANEITQNLGFAIGRENDILNTDAITLGFRNEINESGSILMGTDLRSNAQGSITIGRGANGTDRLTNTMDNSIMLGSLSDVPTVYISPSTGAGTFGNVGIGNITAPTEVLDVNGTARLRVMPNEKPSVLITGDEIDSEGDYVLNYLTFSNEPDEFLNGQGEWVNGTNVCDWNISGQNLTMGWLGSPDACHTGFVGIGRNSPDHKLDVLVGAPDAIGSDGYTHATRSVINTNGQYNTGVSGVAAQLTQSTSVRINRGGAFAAANAREEGGINMGIYSIANDEGDWDRSGQSFGLLTYSGNAFDVYGVYSRARYGERWNVGALGTAEYPVEGAINVGLYGAAYGNNAGVPTNIGTSGYAEAGDNNYGIYGQAPTGTNSWAGYFTGNFTSTGTFLLVSDEQFKTNVEDFESGLDVINQLSPKTYEFLHEQYPKMSLSQGNQYGFIAQELAQVVPELVGTVVAPTLLDSLGNEISSSIECQAVNYIGLVPILISAVKEQQTQIAAQDESIAELQESLNNQNEALAQMMEQIALMQQQLNQCCQGNGGTPSPKSIEQRFDFNSAPNIEGGNELFQNIPNPFRESTTISYLLEEGGRVQLNIYDKTGKVVTTLTDANQSPGRYSEVWNANGMPSGVYHYALYVNGELLVKRAIKLQE